MLNWAITFLVIALIAGVLGLSGVAGAATQIAWRRWKMVANGGELRGRERFFRSD